MPLVFAYGSNMNPVQMRRRCPSARFDSVVELAGYRLAFCGHSAGWGGAVATIERARKASVWGVVWRISEADLRALDRFEGCPSAYVRAWARGRKDGRTMHLYVHTATGSAARPSALYAATIREGYEHAGIGLRRLLAAVRRAGGLALPTPERPIQLDLPLPDARPRKRRARKAA